MSRERKSDRHRAQGKSVPPPAGWQVVRAEDQEWWERWSSRPSWYYVGRRVERVETTEVFSVSQWWVERLDHLGLHRKADFDWGADARSHDAQELAAALLVDASGAEPPRRAIRAFARDIVRWLPSAGFTVSDLEVDAWLQDEIHDEAWSPWRGHWTDRGVAGRVAWLATVVRGRGRRDRPPG